MIPSEVADTRDMLIEADLEEEHALALAGDIHQKVYDR